MQKHLTPEQRAKIDARRQLYRIKNRDSLNEKARIYQAANRDKLIANRPAKAAYDKIYKAARKEETRQWGIEYRAKNADTIKAKRKHKQETQGAKLNAQANRRYHSSEKIRQRVKEQSKKWAELNPEKSKQSKQAYQDRNREKLNARTAKWRAANPEFGQIYKHRRRARLLGCDEHHTTSDWRRILKAHGYRCAYCGAKQTQTNKLTRDHYIALAKGGTNAARNIVPSCKPCNLRKNAKDPVEFMQSRGFLI